MGEEGKGTFVYRGGWWMGLMEHPPAGSCCWGGVRSSRRSKTPSIPPTPTPVESYTHSLPSPPPGRSITSY